MPDAAAAERLLGAPVVVGRAAPYVNDFPALPVRDEPAVVVFASFQDSEALAAARGRQVADPGWQGGELLELEPTGRSAFR